MRGNQHTIGVLFQDPADRDLVTELLEDLGHDVCAPGSSVVHPATFNGVSMIVADEASMVVKGSEILALKEQSEKLFLPILVALPQKADSVRWLEAGADDVMRFPLAKAEMNARVQAFLRLREQSLHLARSSEDEFKKHALDLGEQVKELSSHRKKAEEERVRLHAAIEQAAECIAIFDTEGNITYTNPAFLHISGYDKDECLGNPVYLLWETNAGGAALAELMRRVKSGQAWNGRLRGKRKDGTSYDAETAVFPIRDSSGAVISYGCIQRDISLELKAEEQLRLAQKLEALGGCRQYIRKKSGNGIIKEEMRAQGKTVLIWEHQKGYSSGKQDSDADGFFEWEFAVGYGKELKSRFDEKTL